MDEQKVLGERLDDLESAITASIEQVDSKLSSLRTDIALLNQRQEKFYRDTQRRFLLCLLAIGVLAIAISPWLDSSTKGAGLTGVIGLIGIVISRGESSK